MKDSSKGKNKKKRVSMKEAFEKVKVVKSKNGTKKERNDIRGVWWKYPVFVIRTIKGSRPLSYIFLFSVLAGFLCLYLVSSDFLWNIKREERVDFVEGSVGAISSLNPIFLTQNPIDKSIHELVFERFIDIDKEGDPLPGIASSWNISDDFLTYTFDIEDGHYWHDGEPLTIDDVVFTFESAIKLAEKYSTDSVGVPLVGMEVEKVDSDTIRFVLDDTNAIFFEAVSIYIVPKHRLETVSLGDLRFDIFTKYPLGSGPYKVIKSEPNIIILEASSYFPSYVSIPKFTYRIYEDLDSLEIAFRNGELDAISGVDSGGMDFVHEYSNYTVLETSLEKRTKMIFFNNRRDSLGDINIRQALNYITNKELLLEGSGIPGEVAIGVVPSSSWAFNPEAEQYLYNSETAEKLLEDVGYIKNEKNGYYEGEDNKILSFTLSYLENESNDRLVNSLKELWKKEGLILNLEPLTYAQITQEIISTRNFEMLLYEVETTVDPDQYNLWHSLKRDYPDLNLSGYEFNRVDILLEEARTEQSKKIRKEDYILFQKYLMNDAPVMFIYHPQYKYIVPDSLMGPELESITFPEDRFRNISEWHF
jgi:peptide/nickel transport system substrate-binding protein